MFQIFIISSSVKSFFNLSYLVAIISSLIVESEKFNSEIHFSSFFSFCCS